MKTFFRGLLFVAIFTALSMLMANVFTPQKLIGKYIDMEEEFNRNADNIETLIIGDSHSLLSLDAKLLDSAYNFSTMGEGTVQTYYKLKKSLDRKRGAVKYIIMPMDLHSLSSFRNDRFRPESYWCETIDVAELGSYRHDKLMTAADCAVKIHIPYVGQGKQLINKTFAPEANVQGVLVEKKHTDYTDAERKRVALQRAEFHLKDWDPLYPENIYFLEKIIDLCSRSGIKLVLLRFPVSHEYYEAAESFISEKIFYENVKSLIENKDNVVLLDYHDFFWGQVSMYLDMDHLNSAGTAIFTETLKKKLKND